MELPSELRGCAGALNRLLVVLRPQELFGLDELRLGVADFGIDARPARAVRAIDGRSAVADLGLSLLGQPNVFASELFRAFEIGGSIAHLSEPGACGPARLLDHGGNPVERIGGRLVMLVGC